MTVRTLVSALVAVTRDVAGAQAQLLSAAHISLWSRVRDLQVAQARHVRLQPREERDYDN